MAYTNFQNCTEEEYNEIIYSGDARHKLKLLFNGVEYQSANSKTESLKRTAKILSDGGERFSLDNFKSQTLELTIHDIDLEDIIEPISISIGTLVDSDNNTYEYVPIGVFNLDETPTTNSGKTTIKMSDNAVKFDFPYNAQEVIEANDGSASMLQILQDICTKAGVTLETTDFPNKDTYVSVWDNSINARQYVMYIAEKAGRIAAISRTGSLVLINLQNSDEIELDPLLFEKYTEGDLLEISRVVYEDAIRKFEYGDETAGTLYINSSNPYIVDTIEIQNVYNQMNGFNIYSMNISKMIGNPAIDPWDIIKFTYNDKTYKTLGQNILTYNGVIIHKFDTQIGTNEKSQENVTINSEDSKFKRVFTRIDQAEGNIELNTSQITNVQGDLEQNYYTKEQANILIQNAETGVTNTFSEAGGNNIFRNTGLWFADDKVTEYIYPSSTTYPSSDLYSLSQQHYEFWDGYVEKIKNDNSSNLSSMLLKNGYVQQKQTVPNGNYTVSFKYKKLINVATCKVFINGVEYPLTQTTDTEFVTGYKDTEGHYVTQPLEVSNREIMVKFYTDADNACEIYDLMVNAGTVKLAYSQNQNETKTDTVNISKGITITSTDTDTIFKANADGIRTLNQNNNVLTEFTDTGMKTKKMEVNEEAQICGTLIKEVANQTWFTKL